MDKELRNVDQSKVKFEQLIEDLNYRYEYGGVIKETHTTPECLEMIFVSKSVGDARRYGWIVTVATGDDCLRNLYEACIEILEDIKYARDN